MWVWAYLEFVGTLLHIANTFGLWDSGFSISNTGSCCTDHAGISDADISGAGHRTETTLSGVGILRQFFVVALAEHRGSIVGETAHLDPADFINYVRRSSIVVVRHNTTVE